MDSFFQLAFDRFDNDIGIMAQNVSIMSHPEIYILISIHIPDSGPFPLFYKERIGRKVMDIMGYASWHHSLGTLEKVFRKGVFFPIGVKKMAHSSNLRKEGRC
jgi:hypothetical protein